MDWSNVTPEELVDALREVDWLAPRPVGEFFSKFSIPKNQTKWTSRLKCNVYYYRTNYLAVLVLALLAAFFRQPLSLLASGLSILALLCFNDPFTAAVNDVAVKLLRKLHPHAAAMLRSRCTTGSAGGSLATSQMRQSNVRVLGLQRALFVGLVLAGALYCYFRSRGWLRLLLALLIGLSLLVCHASLRSPNLKARLASAREEFRAVWRGYQADIARHDYTL